MRARKAGELKPLAKDGPVVLINAHLTRRDALILMPNSNHIAHLHLDNFSPEKSSKARAQLGYSIGRRGDESSGLRAMTFALEPDDSISAMLATLWSDIVYPVLKYLGYTRTLPVHQLPHLTWCTTGALSFLPLHAAGLYDGSQPNTFDLVVCSYTPTLSALLTPNPLLSNPSSGVLAVGQEHTPGLAPLPNTGLELTAIKGQIKATLFLQLDGSNATVDSVLGAMSKYPWVHLACHATQHPSNPADSAFRLHDGNLTLAGITKQALKDKGLAFLSACQTAAGDSKLPDEAIHLAAGMLMEGYPSVIATMRSIYGVDGPTVATEVYADLLKEDTMDCRRSARALHKAVAILREKVGDDAFSRWVPFIHIGV